MVYVYITNLVLQDGNMDSKLVGIVSPLPIKYEAGLKPYV